MKTIATAFVLTAALLGSGAAYANGTGGHTALSLAELVGLRSPQVSPQNKFVLDKFLNGVTTFASANTPITINSSLIDCGAGDVDITHYFCDLTFGSQHVQLNGPMAQQLYATFVDAGNPTDGAAGTIHESVTNLSCTVDVGQVKQRAGGGATCTFTPN